MKNVTFKKNERMKKVNLKEVLPYMPEIILLGGTIVFFLKDMVCSKP